MYGERIRGFGGRPGRCVTTVATRKGGCRPTRGDQGATTAESESIVGRPRPAEGPPEPFSSPSVSNGEPSPSRVHVECHLRAFGLRCFTTVSMRGREGRRATRGDPTSGVGIDGGAAPRRPRPAEGPTRDRLTLQLAISVRGQLQICNSAPLHAGPILPRSTRLAELYLARRGRLCTATGRDRSTGYSQ